MNKRLQLAKKQHNQFLITMGVHPKQLLQKKKEEIAKKELEKLREKMHDKWYKYRY